MFTLMTGVTGLGELQSETSDRDPCSSFVTESAWPTWGIPSLPTYVLVFILSDSIGSGDQLVSRWRFHFLGLPRPALGKRGATRMWWCFSSCARRVVVVDHAVVVGHGQATSRPIRSRSIVWGMSHRFRVRLICIKWKKEKISPRRSNFPDWRVPP